MGDTDFRLSAKVIERIAEAAILAVPGSCTLDAKLAGLAGRALPRVVAHLDADARTATIEADIAVTYPSPVAAVADAARAAVITHVRALTGFTVRRVTIKVANAKAVSSASRVSAEAVAAHGDDITPKEIVVRSSAKRVRSVHAPTPRPLRPISVVPRGKAHG